MISESEKRPLLPLRFRGMLPPGALLLLLISLSFLILGAEPEDLNRVAPKRETVILLHGLARLPRSLRHMAERLQERGYDAYALGYPSCEKTVEQIVTDHLVPFVNQCQTNAPKKIHFVAHSMGNILLRQYFAEHSLTNAGRIVMLGPPNQGSEIIDQLGDWPPFEWIYGPAGSQLGTSSNSLPQTLPAPPVEFGVVAGTHSINWILSCLIPGPDDGKVSLKRVKLKGASDFITVPVSHPFLMRDDEVIELTARFLESGTFTNAIDNAKSADKPSKRTSMP